MSNIFIEKPRGDRNHRHRPGSQPDSSVRSIDFAVWGGIGVVILSLLLMLSFMRSDGVKLPNEFDRGQQLKEIRNQGPLGLKAIAQFLANPGDDSETALHILSLIPDLDGEKLTRELSAALASEKGDSCLVSLALCMIGDERGLRKFISILDAPPGPPDRFCSANFFACEKPHPLQEHYGGCDDVLWAVNVVEDTLSHSFGADKQQKREAILTWWRSESKGKMIDWQKSFLSSSELANRSSAFEFLFRRTWSSPSILAVLSEAMTRETDTSLRGTMALKLFRRGERTSLAVMNEMFQASASNEQKSCLLAEMKLTVQLPSEFYILDTWQEGRDNEKSFIWMKDWWSKYYQFLVFRDNMWRVGGLDTSDPEFRLD
ncbi:MAG: hypothetical protein WC712_09325 [Candidatus Brocadiia bacterium]